MVSTFNLTSTVKRDYRFGVFSVPIWVVIWVVPIFCFPAFSFAEDLIIEMAKNQKDAAAQYYLGRRYLSGINVKKNEALAAKWFLEAAKQGHMKAHYEVGLLYKNGRGINKDNRAAFGNFLGASEQGHSGAMFEVANYFFFGLDGSKDIPQAVVWYRNAAELDHGAAQYQLGKILTEGMGIKANKKEGQKWLDKARFNGVDPKFNIAGGFIPSDTNLNDKQSKSSNSNTLVTIKKEGVDTQFSTGMRYLNGVGEAKQPKIAAQWLREAALNDHAGAQFELGKMYLRGTGVKQSNGEAIKWLRKAASWGLPLAKATLDALIDEELASYIKQSPSGNNIKKPEDQYKVGIFYLEGTRLEKNQIKAANWILKAARNKHPKAQYKAGMMYRDGVGTKKDLVKAKYWLDKSSENGNVDARKALIAFQWVINTKQPPQPLDSLAAEVQSIDPVKLFKAGMVLLTKKGVEKDTEKSIQWLTQAAKQRHLDAQKQLAKIYTNGEVIDRDLPAAATWLKMAAEAGDADSQYQLGNIYKEGLGVDKSNSLAVKWYRVAARQGHPEARSKLGCKIC